MNILLWVFQVLAALLYGASGVMKAFMSDRVSRDVPSFGALPQSRRSRPDVVLHCFCWLSVANQVA